MGRPRAGCRVGPQEAERPGHPCRAKGECAPSDSRRSVRPAKADVFSGRQSHRGNSQTPRSLDGRAAGNPSSEAHRRNHRKDGSEWPGRNVSERKGSLEKRFRRSSAYFTREGSRDRRSLADATTSLRRGVSDGTAPRTRQAAGETLLVPPRNRRSRVGRITGSPGKAADGERVAGGPAEAMERGEGRRRGGACCSATPPTTWKAGAS